MSAAEGPLRVCLVSEEEEGWGGIGTYTAVLARALSDLRHTVHVVLRDWEQDRREELDGIVVHRMTVPEPSWRRGSERVTERLYSAREALEWSYRVNRCVRRIARNEGLDVVEVPEYRGAGAMLALAWLRLGARSGIALAGPRPWGRPAPLVVRLHTPAFLTERENDQRERTVDQRAVELLERTALRRADLITAPSVAVAQAVADRWHLPIGRIAVVPNPVDEQVFSPYRELVDSGGEQRGRGEERTRNDGERPVVLCVARLERIKGVDVLVEALPELVARHPDVQIRLVGEDDAHGHGGASMAAHLRERARALGVPDGALRIDGAVPRGELPSLLRQASVCVVPSRWENLPYACIEAMACACPVIASRVGGLSEVIADGRDGLLVASGDVGALAKAILRLLDDRPLADRLGAAARANVECRFGGRAVAAQIVAVYETIRR